MATVVNVPRDDRFGQIGQSVGAGLSAFFIRKQQERQAAETAQALGQILGFDAGQTQQLVDAGLSDPREFIAIQQTLEARQQREQLNQATAEARGVLADTGDPLQAMQSLMSAGGETAVGALEAAMQGMLQRESQEAANRRAAMQVGAANQRHAASLAAQQDQFRWEQKEDILGRQAGAGLDELGFSSETVRTPEGVQNVDIPRGLTSAEERRAYVSRLFGTDDFSLGQTPDKPDVDGADSPDQFEQRVDAYLAANQTATREEAINAITLREDTDARLRNLLGYSQAEGLFGDPKYPARDVYARGLRHMDEALTQNADPSEASAIAMELAEQDVFSWTYLSGSTQDALRSSVGQEDREADEQAVRAISTDLINRGWSEEQVKTWFRRVTDIEFPNLTRSEVNRLVQEIGTGFDLEDEPEAEPDEPGWLQQQLERF